MKIFYCFVNMAIATIYFCKLCLSALYCSLQLPGSHVCVRMTRSFGAQVLVPEFLKYCLGIDMAIEKFDACISIIDKRQQVSYDHGAMQLS
ncbi:MAG: hypothetical protein ABIN93_19455 [Ginsengibacter sp.]